MAIDADNRRSLESLTGQSGDNPRHGDLAVADSLVASCAAAVIAQVDAGQVVKIPRQPVTYGKLVPQQHFADIGCELPAVGSAQPLLQSLKLGNGGNRIAASRTQGQRDRSLFGGVQKFVHTPRDTVEELFRSW